MTLQPRYEELGYKVHEQTDQHTIMLKQGKVRSAIVLGPSGQTERVLNGTQIDKLLNGEDIMAVKKKATTKKKATVKKTAKKVKTKAATKKSTGSCAQVHEICDKIYAKKKKDITRADVLDACEAKGINKSTAATQWNKWKVAKGL